VFCGVSHSHVLAGDGDSSCDVHAKMYIVRD
jgi:hypothetical protein